MLCLNFKININNKNHKILMRGGTVTNPIFFEAGFYGRSIKDCKKEFIKFLNLYKKDIRYKIYDWYVPPVIDLLNSSEAITFDVISSTVKRVKFQINKKNSGEFILIEEILEVVND